MSSRLRPFKFSEHSTFSTICVYLANVERTAYTFFGGESPRLLFMSLSITASWHNAGRVVENDIHGRVQRHISVAQPGVFCLFIALSVLSRSSFKKSIRRELEKKKEGKQKDRGRSSIGAFFSGQAKNNKH